MKQEFMNDHLITRSDGEWNHSAPWMEL